MGWIKYGIFNSLIFEYLIFDVPLYLVQERLLVLCDLLLWDDQRFHKYQMDGWHS
jgi:hypothetical protein